MQKMMPAIVKAKAEPGLWLEQVPVPNVGPDDVLIRTKKASICGTDIHIYNWDAWAQKTIPVPMTIGHEFVGEIVSPVAVISAPTRKVLALIARAPGPNSSPFPRPMRGTRTRPFLSMCFP